MTAAGWDLAQAAENLIGCRFRLHGRSVQTGVDCAGVVLVALHSIGRSIEPPASYCLRNLSFEPFMACVHEAGLVDVTDRITAGDVVLLRPSAAQFHLGVMSTYESLIHAHSLLKRVVSTPLPFQWPFERHWRLSET